MAKKKGKPRTGTKAEFVRNNPSLTASELVKLGKSHGVALTESYIYNIRSATKANGSTTPPAVNGAALKVPEAALPESERLADKLIASLAGMVRTIVREEIRRMLA